MLWRTPASDSFRPVLPIRQSSAGSYVKKDILLYFIKNQARMTGSYIFVNLALRGARVLGLLRM